MRRSTKAALTLAAGAGLWTAWRQANRRPLVPPVVTVVAVMSTTKLWQWWNPLSWLSAVGGIATSAVSDIEAWAKRAIDLALRAYDSIISPVIHGLEAAAWDAAAAINQIIAWTRQAAGWIQHLSEVVIPEAAHWALSEATSLVNQLSSWAQGAIHEVTSWASAAIHGVSSALDWLTKNVIDPVVSWIQSADSWLMSHLASWWSDVWTHTLGPLFHQLAWLWANVPHWIDWLINEAFDAVTAVVKAIDWIIWFGEHTLHEVESGFDHLPGQLDRSLVRSMVSHGEAMTDEVEQWFTDILGS